MKKLIQSLRLPIPMALLLSLQLVAPSCADDFDADPDLVPFRKTPRAPIKEGKVNGGYHRSIYAGPSSTSAVNGRNKTAPDTTYNINAVNYDDYLRSMGKKSPSATKGNSLMNVGSASEERAPSKRPFVLTAVDNEVEPVKKPKTSMLSKVVRAPRAALGVAVAVPVNIARDTTTYTKKMRTSMVDGIGVDTTQPDLVGNGFATATSIPFGVGAGIVQGTIKGFRQGVGKDKPLDGESPNPRNQAASREQERTE
jgi:hypothetical protein